MFEKVMNVKARHSAALQRLGFSKWTVRNYSPVDRLLTYVAYRLVIAGKA